MERLVDRINYERLVKNLEEDIFSIPGYENDCYESDSDEIGFFFFNQFCYLFILEEQFGDNKKIPVVKKINEKLIIRLKKEDDVKKLIFFKKYFKSIEKDEKYDWPWY